MQYFTLEIQKKRFKKFEFAKKNLYLLYTIEIHQEKYNQICILIF
jgi:hypothetical protein